MIWRSLRRRHAQDLEESESQSWSASKMIQDRGVDMSSPRIKEADEYQNRATSSL